MNFLAFLAFAAGSYQILTDSYEQPLISGLMGFGTVFFLLSAIYGD